MCTLKYDPAFSVITRQWLKLASCCVLFLLLHYRRHNKPLIVSVFKVFMLLIMRGKC